MEKEMPSLDKKMVDLGYEVKLSLIHYSRSENNIIYDARFVSALLIVTAYDKNTKTREDKLAKNELNRIVKYLRRK